MARDNFSPFNPNQGWGTAPSTPPDFLATLKEIAQCTCVGVGLGGSSQTPVSLFTTASELRAFAAPIHKMLGVLLYIETEEGGGGGMFRYDAFSSAADDGADTFKPDSVDVAAAGRWVRIPVI